MTAAILRVALDVPLRRLFDYLPPRDGHAALPGTRVRVPFGRQKLVGLVVDVADHSELPPGKLKPIIDVLDEQPVLDTAALGLLRWAAEYYHHPIGEVLAAAMPKALRAGAPAIARVERWMATVEGREGWAAGEPKRAPRQRRLLEYLVERGDASSDSTGNPTADELGDAVPGWRDAARTLARRGWIASVESAPSTFERHAPTPARPGAPHLGDEQQVAVEAIVAGSDAFHAFVLHGITGSGKTEVYLHVVEQVRIEAIRLANRLEQLRHVVEIAGGRPDVLGGHRRVRGLVEELVARDAVRRSHARHTALRPDRLVAHFDVAAHLLDRFADVAAVGVPVHHHAGAGPAAQQLVQRQVRDLRLDVPERRVDRGDGRHRDGAAPPVGASIKVLPGVLDLVRVAADEAGDHVLRQIGRHRELAPVQRGVADAVHALVRDDLQRDEVAPRAGDDDSCFDDLHGLTRSPAAFRAAAAG